VFNKMFQVHVTPAPPGNILKLVKIGSNSSDDNTLKNKVKALVKRSFF
jgi:hypothetical protein